MWLTLASDGMNLMELTDYMERYLLDRFATIPGVSQINIFGSGGPSMRVWIDRHALTARNLTVADIETALTRENVELPAGRLESRDLDFQVRIARNFQTADSFRNLVIAQGEDGHLVRLGEVANVEIASREQNRIFRTNGALTTGFGIIKASTANTVEVLDAVKAEVDEVNADLPEGMELITSGDESLYIRAAIDEIYWTIGITTALVGFVIFVFLGSLRATLIPLVTIPDLLDRDVRGARRCSGYSINLVTLLALALSIGLVVDDAIVVLENAHRRIEEGEAPLLAAFNGTRQVAFAVIATTVVLVSVFAPVAFLRDSIGRVFAELAVTIAAAVIFSAVLALSLSPMMCSKLLRSSTKESKLTHTLDQAFVWLSNRYQARSARDAARAVGVGRGLRRDRVRRVSCCCKAIPQEYAPVEDRGQFNGQIQAPEGTSYERLRESAMKVEAALQKYFDDGSDPTRRRQRAGLGQQRLRHRERHAEAVRRAQDQHAGDAQRSQQAVGRDPRRPRQRVHEQRQPRRRRWWRRRIARAARARRPELRGARALARHHHRASVRESRPRAARFRPARDAAASARAVDTDRAASLGVTARSIGSTLQTLMSERQVTTYVVDGEEYDVVLQAKPEQRASYSDLSNIFVRADRSGELIPLSNLMALEDMAGPSQLQRHNRMRAVTLSAQLAPGYTLGEALDYLENIIRTRAARHGADRLSRRVARVQGSLGRAVLHVRHRAVRRVPRARGAVRELRASARDHGDGAARRRGRVARALGRRARR